MNSRLLSMKRSLALPSLLIALSLVHEASALNHQVKPGDSLWSLAKRYGVSIDSIKRANELGASDTIKTGQKLSIPETKAKPKPESKPEPELKPEPKPKPEPELKPDPKPEPEPKLNPKTHPEPPASTPRTERAAAEELYSQASPPPAPSTLEERAPSWVLERPAASTQVEKSNAARGGVFPCAAPDPGFGAYTKWKQVAPMAHVILPEQLVLGPNGEFDALFHFHGREPVRKEWVRAMDRAVLIAVDVGIDSGSYATAFSDPRTFEQVLHAVEAEVATRTARDDVTVRRVAISAWSAGYGALSQLLTQPFAEKTVDSVILLDGLHSGYTEHSLDATKLAPFVRFAERAVKGERLMFVSHSSIVPDGYASTTETAHYLIWKTGGKPQPAAPLANDPMGLERISTFSQGNLHVRGFRGIGAADHCAHVGLMRDILRVHLKPRFEQAPAPTDAIDAPVAINGD